MDVAFLVHKAFYVQDSSEPRYKLRGMWVNQAYVKSFIIDSSKIEIMESKLSEWSYCENPDATCVRYEKWSPYVTRAS